MKWTNLTNTMEDYRKFLEIVTKDKGVRVATIHKGVRVATISEGVGVATIEPPPVS